jgi:hypothetical protein
MTRDPAAGRVTRTLFFSASTLSVTRNPLRITPRKRLPERTSGSSPKLALEAHPRSSRLPEHPHRRGCIAALGVGRSNPRALSQPACHFPHPHTPDSVTAS